MSPVILKMQITSDIRSIDHTNMPTLSTDY